MRQSLAVLAVALAWLVIAAGLQWRAIEGGTDGYVIEYDLAGSQGPQHVRFSYRDDLRWRRDVTGPGGAPVSTEAADGASVWQIRGDSGMYARFPFPVDSDTGEVDPFGRWGYWPGALSSRQLLRVLGESLPPYMVSELIGDDVVAGRPVVFVRYFQRSSPSFNSLCVDRELRAVLRYTPEGSGHAEAIQVSKVTRGVTFSPSFFALPRDSKPRPPAQ